MRQNAPTHARARMRAHTLTHTCTHTHARAHTHIHTPSLTHARTHARTDARTHHTLHTRAHTHTNITSFTSTAGQRARHGGDEQLQQRAGARRARGGCQLPGAWRTPCAVSYRKARRPFGATPLPRVRALGLSTSRHAPRIPAPRHVRPMPLYPRRSWRAWPKWAWLFSASISASASAW